MAIKCNVKTDGSNDHLLKETGKEWEQKSIRFKKQAEYNKSKKEKTFNELKNKLDKISAHCIKKKSIELEYDIFNIFMDGFRKLGYQIPTTVKRYDYEKLIIRKKEFC